MLDKTDRELLALLKVDGRATTTTLAARIGVARATVQTRLERLQREGTIKRFTIEISAAASTDTVRAVMLIELEGSMSRSVIAALRRKPELTELHSTNGAWDLVANIETTSLAEFDRILREVREVNGVLNSETCLLLNRA
ncbi:Lrp/AsnC family transcriptional regulator [Litoreibacter sp.]|nr:Lrp/AsnC family transcriptional regulator [Litoreibacter sp.]